MTVTAYFFQNPDAMHKYQPKAKIGEEKVQVGVKEVEEKPNQPRDQPPRGNPVAAWGAQPQYEER